MRNAGQSDEASGGDTPNRDKRSRRSKSYLQSWRYHDSEGPREHDGFCRQQPASRTE